VNDEEVYNICLKLKTVSQRHNPFDLTIDNVTYGPFQKVPPRMVWASGQVSQELGVLQKDLESELYEFAGGSYDKNREYNFSPHITLARINQVGIKQIDAEEMPIIEEKMERTFMVENIEIMESKLYRSGPSYTVLESFKLGS